MNSGASHNSIKSVPATPLGSGIPAIASTSLPSNPISSSATCTIHPFGLAWGALTHSILAASISLAGCLAAMATNAAAVLRELPAQQ